jgi:hypothetical protein
MIEQNKSTIDNQQAVAQIPFRLKLALRAQTVQIADLPLRQDLLAKNVLMTAQRNFCLGNRPSTINDYLKSPCWIGKPK